MTNNKKNKADKKVVKEIGGQVQKILTSISTSARDIDVLQIEKRKLEHKMWNVLSGEEKLEYIMLFKKVKDAKKNKNLKEAIEEYSNSLDYHHYTGNDLSIAFITRVNWQRKQDESVDYTKRNEIFDKCVANIDPNTLKEVEEQVDKKLQDNPNDHLKQEAEFYWKKQGGGSHAQWDKYVKVVKYFTEWQKNQIRFYIEGALSVCENEDRKDFRKMVLDYINTL